MQPIANTRRDDIVYKQLLDNIKAGVWKSGDKLPTENELSKELNVSRNDSSRITEASFYWFSRIKAW